MKHDSSEWRFFLDTSISGLVACLIYNKNNQKDNKSIVPLLFSTSLSESYEDIKIVLEILNYDIFNWKFIADLKVLNCVAGLNGSYCKFCCIFCLWNSRYKSANQEETLIYHYHSNYESRSDYSINKTTSIVREPLINIDNIWLGPLHIKLGIFTQFSKSLAPKTKMVRGEKVVVNNGNQRAIAFLSDLFKYKSEDKIKSGIFNGPEIRRLMKKRIEFSMNLTPKENACWQSFVELVENFFGNFRSSDYSIKINNLISSFEQNNINVSPKLHYIIHHQDKFPSNCGLLGEEKGENFHQELKVLLKQFKNDYIGMIANYCWLRKIEDIQKFEKVRKPSDKNFY